MKQYKLSNLSCASCADKLESEIKKLDGVRDVNISFMTNTLQIDCDDFKSVLKVIKNLEPKIEVLSQDSSQALESSLDSTDSMCAQNSQKSKFWFLNGELLLLIALVVIFIASLLVEHFLLGVAQDELDGEHAPENLYIKILWIGIYLIAGREVFKGAYHSFRRGAIFDENLLMLSASLAAFFIGAWEEAVSVMLFFSGGEYLQNLSIKHSKEAIGALTDFKPPKAHKITKNGITPIDPSALKVNDEIMVYAGEMLPCDGVLEDLNASFDCSALSGESLPVEKRQKEEILAGSIALGKAVKVRITREFQNSQIAKITELIKSATTQKSQTENFITTFARYYTPIVFVIAIFVALFPPFAFDLSYKDWIYRALVILMVSCPCALVISVPIGYFGGLAAASKKGVMIKGSNYLEALSQLSLLGFDKTGTLTKGVFKVIDVIPQGDHTKANVLKYALCAQNLSTHPIAQSIKTEYDKLAHIHKVSEFEELGGLGVRAVCCDREIIAGNDKILHKYDINHNTCDVQGSVLHISVDKHYVGYILIADELKNEAREVLDKLKEMRIEPVMLSGDGKYACEIVAQKLDCKYYHSLLPQDKANEFSKLKKEQLRKVGFVGDGINDAPTLALADVGISMGSGSDLSRQNADVVILNNSLNSLLNGIEIAKKTKTIIYENIIFALGVKGVFIVLGLFGVASIWEAVFGDVGVALIALANAMRTLKIK